MRITLATLVGPTYTSELYEWSSQDLARLYPTKAFASADAAIAWAQAIVDAETRQRLDEEGDPLLLVADRIVEEAGDEEGTTIASRYLWWSDVDDGTNTVEDTFCLRIWETNIG